MNKRRQIDKIIQIHLPALQSGDETVDSILEKYPKLVVELRPRLQALSWLVNAKNTLEPRQGFIASSRAYLEQKIEAMPRKNLLNRLFNRYTPRRWVFNFISPVIILVMLILVINSLVLTSRLSIPGDPFYSTKLVIENFQLALTFDPVERTELYIQFSQERTSEIVELILDGNYDLLPSAANRMEGEMIASLHSLNNLSPHSITAEIPMISSFKEKLSNEIIMLNLLKDTSPQSAHPGIDLAIQVAQTGILALR